MARYYPSQSAAPYSPATFHGAWDQTASAVTRSMATTKVLGQTSQNVSETNASPTWDVLILRAVSGALAAGTIDGVVDLCVGARQGTTDAEFSTHLHLWVTQGDSDAERGVLVADWVEDVAAREWQGLTGMVGRRLAAPVPVTPVAVQAGDRLVLEVGYRAHNATTSSKTGRIYWGGTGADMEDGDTGVEAAWIDVPDPAEVAPVVARPRPAVPQRWRVVATAPGGDAEPVAVPITGGRFSWTLNDAGVANVEAYTRDLKDAGLLPARDNLAGRWLRWAAGPYLWRGKVTAVRARGAGVTEVVAKDFSVLLDARHGPKVSDAGMANPGAVFRRAAEDRYRASDPTRLGIAVDQAGPAVPSIQRSTDLLDLLRTLQRATGWEWRTDHATATLEFRRRVGSDLSASVVLTEGDDVVDFDDSFDLEALYNELLAVPADEPYQRTRTVRVRDEASIARHGLRQTTEVFAGLVTRAGLKSVALARLAELAGQGDTVTVVLDGSAAVCGAFDVGDSVEVRLPGANARYKAKAAVRVYDLNDDTLTVSFEVEEVL